MGNTSLLNMKFVIRINEDQNGEPGDEEVITEIEGVPITGSHTFKELLHEISELTFNERFLRLYTHTDMEREFDLLQYWTQEQRDSTLSQLGFKEKFAYHIDADNYPDASVSPVTIDTDKTWQIIRSGKEGPILTVTPNMDQFRIDLTSYRMRMIGKAREKKLKVIIDPKLDKNGKLIHGTYKAKKFQFSEKDEKLHLDFEPGTNIPQLKINEEIIAGTDFDFIFPLEPQALSQVRLAPAATGAAGSILSVVDFLLAIF